MFQRVIEVHRTDENVGKVMVQDDGGRLREVGRVVIHTGQVVVEHPDRDSDDFIAVSNEKFGHAGRFHPQ